MIETREVNIWDSNIIPDYTFDVDGVKLIIIYVIGALLNPKTFKELKTKDLTDIKLPQIDKIIMIVNFSCDYYQYTEVFYDSVKSCMLDQFLKSIEPRMQPQFMLMLNGWSYSAVNRIIIKNRIPICSDLDFAFLIFGCIKTLSVINEFIYTKMKAEFTNFLVKSVYSVKDIELINLINYTDLDKKEYDILIGCLPDRLIEKMTKLVNQQ